MSWEVAPTGKADFEAEVAELQEMLDTETDPKRRKFLEDDLAHQSRRSREPRKSSFSSVQPSASPRSSQTCALRANIGGSCLSRIDNSGSVPVVGGKGR